MIPGDREVNVLYPSRAGRAYLALDIVYCLVRQERVAEGWGSYQSVHSEPHTTPSTEQALLKHAILLRHTSVWGTTSAEALRQRSEDYNRTEPTGLEYLTTTQKSTSRTVLESRLHLVYMSAFVNKMTGRTDVAMRDTTETSSYQCPRVANITST